MNEFQPAVNLQIDLILENGIVKTIIDKTPHPATGNGIQVVCFVSL
jgi:hypothetical protein